MTEQNSATESHPSCGCKLGRISNEYGLSGLDDELVALWTGDADEQYSTRKLATYVNELVLEAAFEEAGVTAKEGEVENTYRLLTDDDVTSGTQVQTRNELERDGVPVEQVESDFISHQTVYNHLTKCLEASLETPSDEERLERSREKLGSLQNRTAAVTADTVAHLERNDIVDIGDYNVSVGITVTCEDCFEEFTVRDLLENRSCSCGETDR